MPSEKKKEDHLKAFSLRNVQNIFSRILYTDVHHALSFDRLHTNEEGLWGDHLWKETKFWILDLGREATVKLEQNFDALPRWPNLTHFSSVMAVDFTDGTVLGDLSKMIIFAAQDILSSSHCKLGHLLLCCIRYYIEFDVYASFEVHTEETITAGRLALQKFSEIMDEYITESQPETMKNWNFPKKHLISHNVASQILHYDEWLLTSTSMRIELDELDEYNQGDTLDPETNETLPDAGNPESNTVHAHLGSRQGNYSFSDIMHSHGTDRAFTDFRMKLNGFLNSFLPLNNIPLPDGRRIHLRAEDVVIEFRFLRIHYESLVDWRMHRDLLQCNPKFYGSPSIPSSCQRRDNDLGLWRVRAKPHSSSEIISVWSIIRGVALASDPEMPGDYFVIHTVDNDIFLRIKALQAQPLCSITCMILLPYLQQCIRQIRTPFIRPGAQLPSPISPMTHPPNSYSLHLSWHSAPLSHISNDTVPNLYSLHSSQRSAPLSHISNDTSAKFVLPSFVLVLSSPLPYLQRHIHQIHTPFIHPGTQLPSPISPTTHPALNSYSLHSSWHSTPLSHISASS
ncbi:hypothetical protein EV424DRAFT_1544743 [Suillus variegatus]|nr:hypothetical protein EV424DRAFT_1544743 [Suillus variegatus]